MKRFKRAELKGVMWMRVRPVAIGCAGSAMGNVRGGNGVDAIAKDPSVDQRAAGWGGAGGGPNAWDIAPCDCEHVNGEPRWTSSALRIRATIQCDKRLPTTMARTYWRYALVFLSFLSLCLAACTQPSPPKTCPQAGLT